MGNEWIEAVMELMRRHGIAELEYEDDGRHFVASEGAILEVDQPLHRPGLRQADHAPRASETIPAPHIGLVLTAHPLDADAAALPRLVRRGEVIGYLKAGAVLRPVVAPSDGVLSRQLANEGALAGYGTALFELHTARP